MKILVIEDESSVSSFIKRGLEEDGHHVTQAFDGTTGSSLGKQGDFDVIMIDVIMPGMNGIEVCKSIKESANKHIPILMLTALGTTDDIVLGLESGADDYLAKPFKFQELLARLKALNRRKINLKGSANVLKIADLEMNLDKKEVVRAGKLITLTAREFRLLEYLLQNQNRVVSRTNILENVWEVEFDMGTNVIDVYVNYLRKKIETESQSKLIHTVIGMGYVLKSEK
jgi:two-component system copper resistance phosphate regulon response regulator CusR